MILFWTFLWNLLKPTNPISTIVQTEKESPVQVMLCQFISEENLGKMKLKGCFLTLIF